MFELIVSNMDYSAEVIKEMQEKYEAKGGNEKIKY